jgi:hypothetical protein
MATTSMNPVRIGVSQASDVQRAVSELADQISQPAAELVLFFVTSRHDPDRLAAAMARAFPGITAGCTTAGEIGPEGYTSNSLVGVSFGPGPVRVHCFPFASISSLDLESVAQCHRLFDDRRVYPEAGLETDCLGILLADGLSMGEEHLIAALSSRFQQMSIVGGSAGDDHELRRTWVFHDGHPILNGAVFLVLELGGVPFETFRLQDFVPVSDHLVITAADAERRLVNEIECEPAISMYERAVGIPAEQLTPELIASHSLMVQLGGEEYVRSVRCIEPDGSLLLHSAIDEGVVFRFGRSDDTMASLASLLRPGSRAVAETTLAICFDCIHRRLQLIHQGHLSLAGDILGRVPSVGFSTYGEIIQSVHVNQTMTGVLFGWRATEGPPR